MVRLLLFAAILAVCKPVVTVPTDSDPSSQTDSVGIASLSKDCSVFVNAGLGSLLLLRSDPAYKAREASYWAPNAALGPMCILQPRTTADVSRAIKAVSSACVNFAVRSGGHVQWAGGSDVKDGVTIDLGLMTDITYNSQTTVVSIQPGPRWGDVFAALEPYGVGATGGRDADVGIGGFLTGGGNAYLTGRNGFGCDTVVNFEVVLADGKIVNANRTSNPDLWKALKGGWANYGIVTRFDLETTPSRSVWGGSRIHDKSTADQIATALVNFNNQNSQHREDAHLVLAAYNTFTPQDLGLVTVMVDTNDVENAPAFAELQKIPSVVSTVAHTTLGDLAEGGIDPSDDRVHWFTLTFNNDLDIVKKSMKLHEDLISQLKSSIGDDAFSTQCVLQPIPSYFGEIGAKKGGNMLGLDSVKTNSILWLGTVAYKNPAHDKVAHDKLQAYASSLESYAKSKNGNVAWRYINYSDKAQNPLKSYGQANVDFIKKVAAKYDPKGVFQKQMPGSFKITAI